MGKAIPRPVKIRASLLLEKYPDKFTTDFEQNKRFIRSLGLPFSKTEQNLMAGYITRKKKQEADTEKKSN
jgi:small subunit ribosomal protein S17e